MDPKTRTTWTVGQVSWPVLKLANRDAELLNWLRFRSVCEAEVRFGYRAVADPFVVVIKNLLLRGWPCPVTQRVDDWLAAGTSLLEIDQSKSESGESGHEFKENSSPEILRRVRGALAQLDCRLASNGKHARDSLPSYDSAAEAQVGEVSLPHAWGDWTKVAFRRQGRISGILDGFEHQKADFVLSLPATGEGELPRLWCLEVDGSQHQQAEQAVLDRRRDVALTQIGGGCVRLPLGKGPELTGEITDARIKEAAARCGFATVLRDELFLKCLQETWHIPMWAESRASNWLELVAVPLAIARVQRAIIHAIEGGVLALSQKHWVIAIDERDVPCGKMAVEDLVATIAALAQLSGGRFSAPLVEVVVRSTPEFMGSKLHSIRPETQWSNRGPVQLLIDVSVLQHFGQTSPLADELNQLGQPPTIVIRNAEIPRTDLRGMEPLGIGDTICWDTESQGAQEVCEQLLRDVFRKKTFREGQWPIIARALQREHTVGVLPTGSGKSICYQLSCLLQPCQALAGC
jgi:hypothetical protein